MKFLSETSASGIMPDGWYSKWLPFKALLLLVEPSHALVDAEKSVSLWNLRSKNEFHDTSLDIWDMVHRNQIKTCVSSLWYRFPHIPTFRAEDASPLRIAYSFLFLSPSFPTVVPCKLQNPAWVLIPSFIAVCLISLSCSSSSLPFCRTDSHLETCVSNVNM